MLAGAAKALAGLKSLYVLPRTLWIAFGIYFVLGFLNVSSMKLYLPLLRSLVVCDAVGEGLYSGSLRCGDFAEVISVSLQQEAWLVGVKLLCRMVSGPILGALCDSHGRKPVLLLSVAGFTLASWLIALAVTQDLIPPIAILTFALAVQGLTTAFKLCFNSMIADLLDKEQLQKGFVVLNHVDVLSRGLSLCFVIWIQKVQFMHFGFLCSMAGSLGVVVLLLCHRLLPETLTSSNGDGPKGMAKDMSLPGLLRSSFAELQAPFDLLWKSRFLQIRLLQMLLLQLGNGWESVQDSFVISILGWGPGDWDLFNVPISSFRELWGIVTSGFMLHWANQEENRFLYVQANVVFGSAMLLVQSFAPFGAFFLLMPRCLLALWPGDGGADAAFFSLQFPRQAQASANGLLIATDNISSGLARWIFARWFFDPPASGWRATLPLWARTIFTLLSNALCLYSWWRYSHTRKQE